MAMLPVRKAVTFFINPALFMERHAGSGLRLPAAVVVISSLPTVLVGLLSFLWLGRIEAVPTILTKFGLAVSLLAVVAISVGKWFLITGTMLMLALVFNSFGQFRTTLSYTAWGFIPQFIGSILTLAAAVVILGELPVGLTATQLEQQFMTNPLFQMVSLVGLAFDLWTIEVWVLGLKQCLELSIRQALVVVGVPASVELGIQLLGYI